MRLNDKYGCYFMNYTEPTYIKYNGVYGYIIVSIDKIYFIYTYECSLICDDISHELIITNS